ncbi:MAG: hypothetical protein WCC11_10350 [Gammaproteobacteria bacterium]
MYNRWLIAVLAGAFCLPVFAANYNGVDIDGETYSCQAYSYDTSEYYNVDVEFDGDQAILHFENGGTRTLDLDDEDIDDLSSISAYDYENAVFWDIDCSDADNDDISIIHYFNRRL